MKFSQAAAFCCSLLLSSVAATSSNAAANPAGIAFARQTNVSLYGKPTGMLITGRCNRYAAEFATARARGAEVLAYINPTSRPDHKVCTLDQQFFMNNYGAVPLWPYPSYGQRSIWPGTKMTDMRAGGKWNLFVVSYIEKLMRERKVDGVFLDVVGARPWNQSNWTAWPQSEKDAWTRGSIDLVKRIDAKRRAINPNFIVMVNNVWTNNGTLGLAGEQYVDGVCIEHPNGVSAWHKNYVAKRFSNLGHKRVLVVGRSASDARAWQNVPGVTHVSGQATSQYGNPTVPPVGFRALNDR